MDRQANNVEQKMRQSKFPTPTSEKGHSGFIHDHSSGIPSEPRDPGAAGI